jgi:hypothetical protein
MSERPPKGDPPTSRRPSQTGRSYPEGPSLFDIPAHKLDPAEADLKHFVNTRRREPHHWWLYTWEGRHQRELLERLGWWAA